MKKRVNVKIKFGLVLFMQWLCQICDVLCYITCYLFFKVLSLVYLLCMQCITEFIVASNWTMQSHVFVKDSLTDETLLCCFLSKYTPHRLFHSHAHKEDTVELHDILLGLCKIKRHSCFYFFLE